MVKYTAPGTDLTAFHCPACGAYASVEWHAGYRTKLVRQEGPATAKSWQSHQHASQAQHVQGLHISRCSHCGAILVWMGDACVYPSSDITGPPPDENLPGSIRADLEEARSIALRSPRGAAALLRLCLQDLCKELGQPGKNINEDIGGLVRAGLSAHVQMALDAVRVIGNNAVHPGELDLRDDLPTVIGLMELLNFISEQMIGQPRRVKALFDKLPAGAQAAISRRDGKSS